LTAYLSSLRRSERTRRRAAKKRDELAHQGTIAYPSSHAGTHRYSIPPSAREAGFAQARQIFLDPTDFFRLFRFDGSAATR
jgi:hypothetical protein